MLDLDLIILYEAPASDKTAPSTPAAKTPKAPKSASKVKVEVDDDGLSVDDHIAAHDMKGDDDADPPADGDVGPEEDAADPADDADPPADDDVGPEEDAADPADDDVGPEEDAADPADDADPPADDADDADDDVGPEEDGADPEEDGADATGGAVAKAITTERALARLDLILSDANELIDVIKAALRTSVDRPELASTLDEGKQLIEEVRRQTLLVTANFADFGVDRVYALCATLQERVSSVAAAVKHVIDGDDDLRR